MPIRLNSWGGHALVALALFVVLFTGCTGRSFSEDPTNVPTIKCNDAPGSDPVSCEGGYYVFGSRFNAVLWAATRPTKPDPRLMEARFDKGWKTGIRYACNLLYGGPGPFGQWKYVVDPADGSVIAHKVLAWVILGAEAPNEQPTPVTYRRCYELAENGPPHVDIP